MKKRLFVFAVALSMLVPAMPALVFAETTNGAIVEEEMKGDKGLTLFGKTKTGQLGNVLSYASYEDGSIIVTSDSSIRAIAAAYEDGKMVAYDEKSLTAGGQETLKLENWGQEVKLFAVSENYRPLCAAEKIWDAREVDVTAETAEELENLINSCEEDKILVINVAETADFTGQSVDATFKGKELTINFNNVDMSSLKITARNAESIMLNDAADGEAGTVIKTLTIYAPNAEVISHVAVGTVDIIAVKNGTFHAKDAVENIQVRKGAVNVDNNSDTKVTVPHTASGDVKIEGAVKEVDIHTSEAVTVTAAVETANVKAEYANVIVEEGAVVATVNVEKEAANATVAGGGTVTKANISAEATVDTASVTTLIVEEPVKVTVGKNAAVGVVDVSAATTEAGVTAEVSGKGTIAKIEANGDVAVSATNVTKLEVSSGVTAEVKANIENITVPAGVETAPTIKVDAEVKVDTVTTESNVNMTGSGTVGNVDVAGSDVMITAPADSAITVESIVTTGDGSYDITYEEEETNQAEFPETATSNVVKDTVDEINIDLNASDEWRTDGYLYKFFDIGFNGAEWAVTDEEFDWSKVTYWVNGEPFIWNWDTCKPGDFAVEVDIMEYSYDPETETEKGKGTATGLVAAFVKNVAVGESYEAEIRFPSSYLRVTDDEYQIVSGKTFTVDFTVNITQDGTPMTAATDKLSTLTISPETAADWRTEGYVYIEEEITFDGAKWSMEPYWEEHVTYWIDGEQFIWDPETSKPGEYPVELDMAPVYDEDGNLIGMNAMVFAYVDHPEVKEGNKGYRMEIRVPTYSLTRDGAYRITRDTAVIDFTVHVGEGFDTYIPPVRDAVKDINIDLSVSDEWKTDGYLYQFFDIAFTGAEWAVAEEDFDRDAVTYWVNGEQFDWYSAPVVGAYAVEVDLMGYSYDSETKTGTATGLIAAYVDKVNPDETYEVEIQFPSSYLEKEDTYKDMEETFTVDFNVNITDSEVYLTPAKDTLDRTTLYLSDADEDDMMAVTEEIKFDGAAWCMEPNWEDHVTYEISNDAVAIEMEPQYDVTGSLIGMNATVAVNKDDVAAGETISVKIYVPTYSLERTDEEHRITRNETAVIDFNVFIAENEDYKAEVTDTVDDSISIDLSASDEWRTDGYLYQFFDIGFNGAEWAVEDLDWDNVEYYVNGDKFEWIVEGENPSQPGDFAVEVDIFGYSYDYEAETGTATGLVAAYVKEGGTAQAKPDDEPYHVEIRFPSDHLRVTDDNYVLNNETYTIDFDVNITQDGTELTPAKDKVSTLTISPEKAEDWRTEGYVYIEEEITFDGAEWIMEPYWDHVTYWIDGEQFIWDPETSKPGEYPVELDMAPVYDDDGNLSGMNAMVFAYVDHEEVRSGNSYSMKIEVPTYMLERTTDNYRITRNETAVIDFNVDVTGFGDYKLPVADRVEDMVIDLSASDEWITDGYLYQFFDIGFTGAEWAVAENDFEWDAVTYWVDGEQFDWYSAPVVGAYAVEVDLMGYSYDDESGTGTATGIIAAYVDNVNPDETYEVEIRFPSDHLRITDEAYEIKGEEVTASFNVYIAESEEPLEPAKDTLDEVYIDPVDGDAWGTAGYVYIQEEITFDGARWSMEPNWREHVTYWIEGEQFEWIDGVDNPGDYEIEVEMVPVYDDEGNLSMQAMVFAYVKNVEYGESFDVEIEVPTYSLERTEDDRRITRNETAVIDFTVKIDQKPFSAEVTGTKEDYNLGDEKVTEGTFTVYFNFENYTGPVTFGLMHHNDDNYDDDVVVLEETFAKGENDSDTEGSVIFDLTGIARKDYEVVYQVGDTCYGTGVYVVLVDSFKVFAEEINCKDNGSIVTSGEIKVDFNIKNYTEPVIFGLMDEADHTIQVYAYFERENESATEGSVTFEMEGVRVAHYEVVYLLGDTMVGTGWYIDLREQELPEEVVGFTLNGSNDHFYMTWNDLGDDEYQVRIYDGDTKVHSMPYTTDTISLNLLHFIPCTDEGKAYDIVLKYGSDEVARLEGALVVRVTGSEAEYSADFSATGVTATWINTPSGKGKIFELKNNDGKTFSGGGTPVSGNVTVNADLTSGGVLDLRVVTEASLIEQVLDVTITPKSEAVYQVTENEVTE